VNLKTTLALLVVLLAIGGAAWWLGRPDAAASDPGNVRTQSRQPLLPQQLINLNRLTRIEIQQPGSTCVLENTDTGWRMTSPVNAPINPAAITEIQGVLGVQSYMPGEEERLNKPTDKAADYAIALHANDQHVTVSLRETLGGGYSRVTLEHGDTQARYTTEIALHHLLTNIDPTALLASRLDTPTALTAQHVEIDSAAGDIVLRKVDSRWYLGEQGTDQRALSVFLDGFTSVPGYLNITGAADIVQYLPLDTDNPATMGLDRPRAVLRYTLAGEDDGTARTAELRVGSPADLEKKTYFVSYRGPESDRSVYCVLPWNFSAVLVRPADDFRDPRVMETQPGLIESLGGGRSDTGQFLLEMPQAQQGQVDPLANALTQLAASRAVGFVSVTVLPDEPIGYLTFKSRIGNEAEQLRFYTDPDTTPENEGQTILVVRNDESIALRILAEPINHVFDVVNEQAPLQ